MQNMINLDDNSNILIRVSGRVQNVGFRFFTYQKAHKLKLVGYVRNLIDGEVEIVACGKKIQLEALIRWISLGGPSSADIKDFSVKNISPSEKYTDFSVRY
ncbi:acylphosphatase [Orbus wheelerorum]|uniref:acylphosphatase n=1 Tax=Orbus wheelerorum TaxID=3074111 RepID=UPI00370D0754